MWADWTGEDVFSQADYTAKLTLISLSHPYLPDEPHPYPELVQYIYVFNIFILFCAIWFIWEIKILYCTPVMCDPCVLYTAIAIKTDLARLSVSQEMTILFVFH